MAEFKASSPKVELLGGMVSSLWTAFPESFQDRVMSIMNKHGLANIQPAEWYPLQRVLDTLKEIEDTYGHHLLFQVGEQAALKAPVPPEIDSLKACLLGLNVTLKRFNRGGDVGGYEITEDQGPGGFTRYVVVASTPYPCSLTRGYLEGFAKRFGSHEAKEILVRHDEDRPCRREGSDTCAYIVTLW
jgi:hypothetical protein